ncbi:hypothetical protein Hypma_000845 [Hypsizygus marmoreus]|uniref:Uncharacterized protein n=1 Tax=Hypsizygus marmoreus TaxID=39966 RepID=A0A369JBQ7_HYPMA|nr:hypothetical protein Hypma_000845 [Hypsizygus marmoreus]
MTALLMPSTTHDMLMSQLSTHDLFMFARSCRFNRAAVDAYMRRAFNFERWIAPFFPSSTASHFRQLQAATGALITGRAALHFFQRSRLLCTVLDVTVHRKYLSAVGNWLQANNFVFEKSVCGASTWTAAAKRCLEAELTDDYLYLIFESCVAGIVDFTNSTSSLTVKIIAVFNCPLAYVLDYHSTVAMNFITHNEAISLYPRMTLIWQNGVKFLYRGSEHDRDIATYEHDGWLIEEYPPSKYDKRELLHHRTVGDRFCWTIDLEGSLSLPAYPAYANSWQASDWLIDFRICYHIVDSSHLLYSYLVWLGAEKRASDIVASYATQETNMDDDFATYMTKFYDFIEEYGYEWWNV